MYPKLQTTYFLQTLHSWPTNSPISTPAPVQPAVQNATTPKQTEPTDKIPAPQTSVKDSEEPDNDNNITENQNNSSNNKTTDRIESDQEKMVRQLFDGKYVE